MKVLLAHPGTQYSGQLAAQLYRIGVLESFHTGFAIGQNGLIDRIVSALPDSYIRPLSNRRIQQLPSHAIRLHCWDEGMAQVLQRAGCEAQEVLHARNARFQGRISDRDLSAVDVVVGFDTSGWILAQRCRELGRKFLLDQSIGHPDSKSRIYEGLRTRYPSWSQDADVRLEMVRDAERIEHELSDLIVVASSFSKATLVQNGVPVGKIRINPYGVDCARFSDGSRTKRVGLRFCYVGAISVRKGVPQLLEAWRRLKSSGAELWLIGPASSRTVRLLEGHRGVVYKGSVPHDQLPALLRQCDVFVFPSFFEGFGLVILEAMACGLPVITTTATAGPDVIEHGVSGWIVEPGDDEALVATMDGCLAKPRGVAAAGKRARSAAEKMTWESYGDRWGRLLGETASSPRSK